MRLSKIALKKELLALDDQELSSLISEVVDKNKSALKYNNEKENNQNSKIIIKENPDGSYFVAPSNKSANSNFKFSSAKFKQAFRSGSNY